MTQLRAPLTFPAAMTRVAGVLGWPTCAKMARRSARAVRYWSEDGCTATPTIAQALAYDAAYQAAGGEGTPFGDAYAFQLQGAREQQDACRRQLADAIADVARESGEAIAASIAITSSNASPLSTLRASAEVGQLLAACQRLAKRLVPFLPAGSGLSAGNTGGSQ